MRVLQIVADGNPGGGTTHVLQILRGFRSTHSMGLITQSQSYLFHQAKELDILSYGLHFFPSRVNLAVSFRLNRIYSEWKPDLIHVLGVQQTARASSLRRIGLAPCCVSPWIFLC